MTDSDIDKLRREVKEYAAQHADIDEVFRRFDVALHGLGELVHEARTTLVKRQDDQYEEMRQLARKVEELQRQLLLLQDTEAPPPSDPNDDTPPRGRRRPH